jgi:hypothetical protein
MILSTHAVVGGALGSLFPSHPVAAIAAGFASHFVIDAIPHWDYSLKSISVAQGARNQFKLDRLILRDLSLIGFDALAGLVLAFALFATPATITAIMLGALAAMLPDPLQFAHTLYPREPLRSLQRFHRWIHTKRKLNWPLGVSSQILFVAFIAVTTVAFLAAGRV